MADKIKKIKKKVLEAKEIKQTKESEVRLANLIREKLNNTLGQALIKLSECVFALQQATEKVQKEIKEKQTIVEKQEIKGKVTIANPSALKQKKVEVIGKVKVTNQVDMQPVRDGIRDVMKIASNIMTENSREHMLGLNKMFTFLEKISKQDNNDLLRALAPLQFLSDTAHQPLSVRLSDGERFYEAIATLGQQIYAAGDFHYITNPISHWLHVNLVCYFHFPYYLNLFLF